MNNEIWINTLVTVPVVELVCYWVSIITLAIIAGIGWAFFVTEKNKHSKSTISSSCPLNKVKEKATIINEPHDKE
jgi:hypothetical protein